jgi:hypothetical protein
VVLRRHKHPRLSKKKKKNYYAESITPRHKEEGTGEWDKIRIT